MFRLRGLTAAPLGISRVKAKPLRDGLRPALTLLVTAVRKLTAVMTQPGKPLLSRREARRIRNVPVGTQGFMRDASKETLPATAVRGCT